MLSHSTVTPALTEPLPGWVDNLNGPVGIMVGAGKGVIRSMLCNGNYHAEVIPVDFAINSLIAIAHKTAFSIISSKIILIFLVPHSSYHIFSSFLSRNTSIPVYNITQSGVVPITWGEILGKGKKIAHRYPFEGQIWYPDGDIRNSKFVHNLIVFFFHIIPAYFIDFLMLIFRQKRL